jgi:hypothetical protein
MAEEGAAVVADFVGDLARVAAVEVPNGASVVQGALTDPAAAAGRAVAKMKK